MCRLDATRSVTSAVHTTYLNGATKEIMRKRCRRILWLPFVYASSTTVSALSIQQSPLASHLDGKMIFSPPSIGGNLPFRRLCADFGMDVALGELVNARSLSRKNGNRIERARMRRSSNERCFGVRIGGSNEVAEVANAIELAAEAGADFVQLNPFRTTASKSGRQVTAPLRSPRKVGAMMKDMVEIGSAQNVPLMVNIRLGSDMDASNAREVVDATRGAGIAAIAIDGRSAGEEDKYWDLIGDIVKDGKASGVPIVGCAKDTFTHREARFRMGETGVDSVMVGRDALTKPWIFREFNDGKGWEPDIGDRIEVYRTMVCYMKDHFGDDDIGRKKAWNFLPWHIDYFTRYTQSPTVEDGSICIQQSLGITIQNGRERVQGQSPLQSLLSNRREKTHELIASVLWESDSNADAVKRLNSLSESHHFKEIEAESRGDDAANTRSAKVSKAPHGVRRERPHPIPKAPRSPDEIFSTRSSLSRQLTGKMILAPLTRGGNLPFRRLCADFGMEASLGEMVYARSLLKNDRIEQARLRRAPNERLFGVQIATNQVDEGARAMALAAEAGADFVDLNCGCPIYEATRRGLGSSLLRSPKKLGGLVKGMVESSDHNIPLTVKIRLGCEMDNINVRDVVSAVRDAGAAAVTVHGRTAQQGYSKPADWDLIREVVRDGVGFGTGMPIIGNGDILTPFEARRRMEESGVDSVMVGRGALIKPWIFQEFGDGKVWEPDLDDRIAVYRTLACYMKDHFGDDDMGRKKAWNFLPWHFQFLSRYAPLPEDKYGLLSIEHPLIQTRDVLPNDASPLQSLMSHRSENAHELISSALWESASDADAVDRLSTLAESHEFKKIRDDTIGDNNDPETKELANIPKGRPGRWEKRRGRNPKPPRTPEEIAAIRAERAAKKARLAALDSSSNH